MLTTERRRSTGSGMRMSTDAAMGAPDRMNLGTGRRCSPFPDCPLPAEGVWKFLRIRLRWGHTAVKPQAAKLNWDAEVIPVTTLKGSWEKSLLVSQDSGFLHSLDP